MPESVEYCEQVSCHCWGGVRTVRYSEYFPLTMRRAFRGKERYPERIDTRFSTGGKKFSTKRFGHDVRGGVDTASAVSAE
jgi:hypothetical protein